MVKYLPDGSERRTGENAGGRAESNGERERERDWWAFVGLHDPDWGETLQRLITSTGFKPKNPAKWNEKDRPGGCVRNTHLNCKTDEFLKLSMLKLPRSGSAISIKGMWFDPCRDYCLKNCKCQAFALPVGNANGLTSRLTVTDKGLLQQFRWNQAAQDWDRLWSMPEEASSQRTQPNGMRKIVGVVVLGTPVLTDKTSF
uniref:NS1 glycoprotein, putative; 15463-17897 n=1 Tax=Arabidopsis thaliana TaxID=3702 RepID=Q9FVW1_ARATH|nr:NS1 glycoprotein, putative; 15463-17897 [Arabidopsis thaliana]